MHFVGKYLLPFFACFITVVAISYTACHESKADETNNTPVSVVNQDLNRFEEKIKEMTTVHELKVKNYTDEVGMTSNSTALAMIQEQKIVLEKHQGRLDYHRLQLLHGDTTVNSKMNKMMSELRADYDQICKDLEKMKADADSEASLNIRK